MDAGPRSRPFRRPTATYGRDYQTNNTSDYAHIRRYGEHFGIYDVAVPSRVEILVDSDGCGQRRRVRRPIHAEWGDTKGLHL
jgi:hypothetical protein